MTEKVSLPCNIYDHFWVLENWGYEYRIREHICETIRICPGVIYIADENDDIYYLDDCYFTYEAAKKAYEAME